MPETDADKLNSVLEKQDVLLNLLHNVKSNHLDFLSQDILFKTILKNHRSPVQPASIDFWLSRDTTWKTNNLNLWLEPLLFIKKSIDFILELIRKSLDLFENVPRLVDAPAIERRNALNRDIE